MATSNKPPHAVVVGAGIAGLTAALRLVERGFKVTILEKKAMLGGNLASRTASGGESLDIYPHMFQPWYKNFWGLMEDAHRDAAGKVDSAWKQSFKPFSSVYQAQPLIDGKPQFASLTRPYSAAHLLENLFSGVAPPADMFLFGYASLDLMAERRNPTLKLENVSLTGYLSSRVYMTQTALEAYEAFVLRVWGIPAYMISAADCQSYADYCYATADEDGSLSTGAAQEIVIDPIEQKLLSYTLPNGKPAVTIKTGCEVIRLELEAVSKGKGERKANPRYRLSKVEWEKGGQPDPGPILPIAEHPEHERYGPTGLSPTFPPEIPEIVEGIDQSDHDTLSGFQALVLAVPPTVLSTLVRRRTPDATPRVVDAIPELAELNRVGSAPIPVVHLYLTVPLPELPSDPVALNSSKLSLAFTAISGNWTKLLNAVNPVLALSCSETIPLVGPEPEDDAFAMIRELSEYLPFDPGSNWGQGGDIDWTRTTYDANADAQLSLNSVGTDRWRPETSYPKQVENLFFAGDYCKHDYGITTIEGAVATGVKAAAAAQKREKTKVGGTIKSVEVELLPAEVFVGMRYAWLASALAAMGWSRLTTPSEVARKAAGGGASATGDPFEQLMKSSTLRYLLTPGLPAAGDPPGS